MINPIKSAQDAVDGATRFQNDLVSFIEQALSDCFVGKRYKKPRLLDDMGGVRTVVQMLNGVQMPKGYMPIEIRCTPPIFEQITTKGHEGLKASIAIEIIALKEGANGQQNTTAGEQGHQRGNGCREQAAG